MAKKVELQQLPIEALQRGRFQPRHHFDSEALAELAQSIRQMGGLLQPIVVRPLAHNHYEIIAGERRWRACQLAELSTVSCLVGEYSDEQALQAAIVENINRSDLNIIEEAKAYLRLQEEFIYTHDEIGALVGKSRAAISNLLRLLKLDSRIQQYLIEGSLSEGHGKLLAGLPLEEQYPFAHQCVENDLSVRQLERLIKSGKKENPAATRKDPNIAQLENTLAEQVGSPVAVDYDENGRGALRIQFQNLEILQGILHRFGVKEK
ncbi:MAG: parB 2 [Gammaproteobacteria bacterium]|nr:parB 2 [Gammaproteobacteria bacterium]